MITKYNRDKKEKLKGCVVRTDEDNFGYSLCHHLDQVKNSKKMARKIAIDRAGKTKLEIQRFSTITGQKKEWIGLRRNGQWRRVPHTVEPYLKKLMED